MAILFDGWSPLFGLAAPIVSDLPLNHLAIKQSNHPTI